MSTCVCVSFVLYMSRVDLVGLEQCVVMLEG